MTLDGVNSVGSASILEMRKRAGDWLLRHQGSSGAWGLRLKAGGPDPSVFVTSLSGLALLNIDRAATERAAEWLAGEQQEDGAFGEGGSRRLYRPAATGMGTWLLCAVDRERYAAQIAKAVDYLRGCQEKEGIHRGGFGAMRTGVFSTPSHPNREVAMGGPSITDTMFAAAALRHAEVAPSDPLWREMVDYVHCCHNTPLINNRPDVQEYLTDNRFCLSGDGGMLLTLDRYRRRPEAREAVGQNLTPIISTGLSTLQGMFIYLGAGLSRSSPEVTNTLDWLRQYYTVSEHARYADALNFDFDQSLHWPEGHPGLTVTDDPDTQGSSVPATRLKSSRGFHFVDRGDTVEIVPDRHGDPSQAGLYLYLWLMAECLQELDIKTLLTADDREHSWANEMASHLRSLQRPDGSWSNRNPQFMDNDPALGTSLVLNTLNALVPRF